MSAGIDISTHTSNHVDEYKAISWDFIITVCDHANENCSFISAPQVLRLHHNFYDPSKFVGSPKKTEASFDNAQDEISAYCQQFAPNNL